MKKVFALLLAEFRKLGATIVFANFSKVIIDTGKFDLSTAKAYSDSLIKALQTRFVLLKGLRFIRETDTDVHLCRMNHFFRDG